MKKTEPKFKKYSQTLLRYLIELLIVFAGVYGAFLLSEYKENRRDAIRRGQIYQALVREIEYLASNSHRVGIELSNYKTIYEGLIAKRKMPLLVSFKNPITFTPHLWNATIQSDALNLLEVATIEKLSTFYNETQDLIKLIEEFRGRTASFLMIDKEKARSEFYDLKTGQLRSRYSWYLEGMGQMSEACSTLAAKGDSLLVFLNREKGGR